MNSHLLITDRELGIRDWRRGLFIFALTIYIIRDIVIKTSPILSVGDINKNTYLYLPIMLNFLSSFLIFYIGDLLLHRFYEIIFHPIASTLMMIMAILLYIIYFKTFFNIPLLFSILVILGDLYRNRKDMREKCKSIFLQGQLIDFPYRNIFGPISISYFILNYLALYLYFRTPNIDSQMLFIFFIIVGNSVIQSYYGIKSILVEEKKIMQRYYFNYAHKVLLFGFFTIICHSICQTIPLFMTKIIFTAFKLEIVNYALFIYAIFFNFINVLMRLRLPYALINNYHYYEASEINNKLEYDDYITPYIICESKIHLYFAVIFGILSISLIKFFESFEYSQEMIFLINFIGSIPFTYLLNMRTSYFLYKGVLN